MNHCRAPCALFVPAIAFVVTAFPGAVRSAPAQPVAQPAATTAFDASAPRPLADLLAPIREKYDLPCLAGAIVETDRLAGIGATGVRRAGDDTEVTADDLFHIGSCTKAMTATLIATFVEDGAFSWDTTLEKALPALAGRMDPAFKAVTIEQLLTHRAGIPSDLDRNGLWGRLWRHTGTPTEQRATLAEEVLARPPAHPPGGRYLYANAGFAIAGHIAEVRAGKGWEELMRERLFSPLGMTTAGFGAPGSRDSLDQPRGHLNNRRPVAPGPGADNPAAIGPGGTVHCSLADWGRFVALHLRGAAADQSLGDIVIKRETFAKLHEPVKGQGADYAMGWGVVQRSWAGNPGIALTHSGSNTMWFCTCWLAPEKGFAILVATNIADDRAGKACDEAAGALIGARGQGK